VGIATTKARIDEAICARAADERNAGHELWGCYPHLGLSRPATGRVGAYVGSDTEGPVEVADPLQHSTPREAAWQFKRGKALPGEQQGVTAVDADVE